jgi:hypothetical protein
MDKIKFINNTTNESTNIIKFRFNNLNLLNINIQNKLIILNNCTNDYNLIDNVISGLMTVLDTDKIHYIYNIAYIYLCYVHKTNNILDINYIKSFVYDHIIMVENKLYIRLKKNDIINLYTNLRYINNTNIISSLISTNKNISVLNNIISPTPLNIFNNLYVTLICNYDCVLDENEILFENFYISQ